MRFASQGVLGAFLLAAAFSAAPQYIYKWTDKDGKARLSDRPPANFDGPVVLIPIDTAERRRAVREQLAALVSAAHEKVELARKALEAGDEAGDDEKQYVQQRFERDERRPERTPPPRLNCMPRQAEDGRAIWICPRPVPGEDYYARRQRLEEALEKAEKDLADAQRAYRRGVD